MSFILSLLISASTSEQTVDLPVSGVVHAVQVVKAYGLQHLDDTTLYYVHSDVTEGNPNEVILTLREFKYLCS